jgi:2,4-dienoyl-CoA reductase-like NADH-dependent reductase (Old Yellow Enzyme family)
MPSLFDPLPLRSGAVLKNRFMLAPLTNLQSHRDGVLSDDEYHWLAKRAEGGFGLVTTCASSVHPRGLGFPGQLGCHDDRHLEGLTRLATAIKAHGAHAIVQLHHAGMRAPADITGVEPLCPSDNEETKARAMTGAELREAMAAFVSAAVRAERAGFDGVELHGAHGYLICQFLSSEINRRSDEYGGSLENRARFLMECIDGVRAACKPGFTLGVRLSPERFGLRIGEIRDLAQTLMLSGKLDYLDMSLWDAFKEPNEDEFKGKSLLARFAELERGETRLGVAGKIVTGADAARVLEAGADLAIIGRSAILHYDFPKQIARDAAFAPTPLPVSADYLREQKLGEPFIGYMRTWKGFVAEEAA